MVAAPASVALGFYEEEAILRFRQPFEDHETFPEAREVLAAIPKECQVRSTWRSAMYLLISLSLTIAAALAALLVCPTPGQWNLLSLVMWIVYALAQGTIVTGLWVVAHECGHGAFSDNKTLETMVGFVFHSLMLVPYYSWQRSHALHHAKTNHATLGETHVPNPDTTQTGLTYLRIYNELGEDAWAILSLFNHLVIGWPMYLLTGATGSPERGSSSHFAPMNDQVYPGSWKRKVFISDIGVLLTITGLVWWGHFAGSAQVIAFYVGPYIVLNAWLVEYTWLQHTDMDIPHFDSEHWTWVKGAFATVDRPYPALIDFLHHRIGSTHVAHHFNSRIPHYHGKRATEALKKAFPQYYRYDPTPIASATMRLARKCVASTKYGNCWWYTTKPEHQK